jgi:hypothetical protein
MGTKHVIAAYLGGKCKLAQYGQWDGYPEGQGEGILEFLKTADMKQFRRNLSRTRFFVDSYLKKNWEKLYSQYPQLSRDQGCKILDMIYDHKGPWPFMLQNSLNFVADSLFCEFAYVLDMDFDRLELYVGFSKSPVNQLQRFANMKSSTAGYYPVRLVNIYPFNNLPTVDRMAKDCERDEGVADLLKKAENFHDSNA